MIFACTVREEYIMHFRKNHERKEDLLVEATRDYEEEQNSRRIPKGVFVYRDRPPF